MASNFDRWEKDPFFMAAEEVQDSADRMESAYRKWIHDRKDGDSEEIQTELHTALGTAKWQLEEFERATESCLGEDAKVRHHQFVVAIDNQISKAENSLRDVVLKDGKTELPWVRLDQEERDELALFLIGPSPVGSIRTYEGSSHENAPLSSKDLSNSIELDVRNTKDVRINGHRRSASASAGIGSWTISVVGDERPHLPPPRVPSFSGIIKTVESTSKLKWPKNGFRKWKGGDRLVSSDTEPLQSHQLSEGINDCYERGKSCCLDSCGDEKQIYGWLGAVQRQLQRSQYQIQYSRTVQMTFWIAVAICLIGNIVYPKLMCCFLIASVTIVTVAITLMDQ